MEWLDKRGRAINLGDIVQLPPIYGNTLYLKNEWVVFGFENDGYIRIASMRDDNSSGDWQTINPRICEIIKQANYTPMPRFLFGDKVTTKDGQHGIVIHYDPYIAFVKIKDTLRDYEKIPQTELLEGWVKVKSEQQEEQE